MTQMEALELALRLAIAAPDDKHAAVCTVIADRIAAGMTKEEVDTVQEEVECLFFSNSTRWEV